MQDRNVPILVVLPGQTSGTTISTITWDRLPG